MATASLAYRADGQPAITLASLSSSSTRVAGQESTEYSNAANLDQDAILSGKITTGTSPTTGKSIEIWVIAPINDTPTWPDVFDGTDSAETVTSRDILAACGRLAAVINTDATSNRTYPFHCGSIAALFGGVLPPRFSIFVTHDTGVALHATAGNHEISVQGVSTTIA